MIREPAAEAEALLQVLNTLRVTPQTSEYTLHERILTVLQEAGFQCEHEAKLGPRCRIDLLSGSVGIEIKRGRPDRRQLLAQISRYLESERLGAIIVIAERSVDLPYTINGKPVRTLCLNRLWGIAL